MLYITTDEKNIFIKDVELSFNLIDKKLFNKDVYFQIMKQIDNAICIEEDIIKTPFGNTSMNNLSTGCKTALLLIYFSGQKKYIPITGCGINAIECLFDLAESYDLYAYMNYGFMMSNSKENASCLIDDKLIKGRKEIFYTLQGDI